MFHVTRTKKDYQAFCLALLEITENIQLVNYVGGNRDKVQAGFMIPLKGATFLPCRKHVQDDVARKLTELELSSLKAAILADIFGSETRKEKSLVDSKKLTLFTANGMHKKKRYSMEKILNFVHTSGATSSKTYSKA